MLGSITPLGERSREQTWGATVVALTLGGVLGGALIGAIAGVTGMALVAAADLSVHSRLWLLAAALVAAAAADVAGIALPTPHRQVNENWLMRYRGWVYGAGFGLQLGAGVATIVTTAAVFAVVAAAALSGSLAGGIAIGAAFGGMRTATVIVGRRVQAPEDFASLHRVLSGLEQPMARATPTALALIGAMALAGAIA